MNATRLSMIVACAIGVAAPSQADVVTQWNATALDAIRASQMPPPAAARMLAILHVAMYDAINGIERTYEPFYVQDFARPHASAEAAASTAARSVLVAFFPDATVRFDALHSALLATIDSGPQKHRGIAWGEFVACEILLWRAADRSTDNVPLPVDIRLPAWQRTPPGFAAYLLPQWGRVEPFAAPLERRLRPAGPPRLDSQTYAHDYEEVRTLGGSVSAARTAEQELIARFWADGVGTVTPPGHWNEIARDVSAAKHNTLQQNARLFGLMNVALADAAIAAWDAKHGHNFWRPITAIRRGDVDGNAATVGDPGWTPLIATPPFPEYVSGHSAFSGAAAAVLALFFGTEAVELQTTSDTMSGVVRTFNSFTMAAREAADSRVYGGIHFRSSSNDGLAMGTAIGNLTFARMMRPRARPSTTQ